jgi:hypothetical protein
MEEERFRKIPAPIGERWEIKPEWSRKINLNVQSIIRKHKLNDIFFSVNVCTWEMQTDKPPKAAIYLYIKHNASINTDEKKALISEIQAEYPNDNISIL